MLIRFLEALVEFTGKSVAWLILLMTLITATIVIMRYGVNVGSIFLQETVIYCHAMVFLLASAYTLKHNGHVRVDIFYRKAQPKTQAWIDLLGSLFLLQPVCLFIIWISWNYVSVSWENLEKSNETGGIPALFLLKSLIPLMALLLSLQGFADILKNLQRITKSTHQ